MVDLLQRPALDARLPSIAERSVNTKIGRTITGCAGFRRKYLLIILNSSLANQITARRANRSEKIQDPLKSGKFLFGFDLFDLFEDVRRHSVNYDFARCDCKNRCKDTCFS